MIKITLPFCPSANTAYPANKKGKRVKSKRFKLWLKECPKLDEPKKPIETCKVRYDMYFPDDRIRDGQSYMKLPLDYIVSQGVLKDDNRRIVKSETWNDMGNDKDNPRIEVFIENLGGATE